MQTNMNQGLDLSKFDKEKLMMLMPPKLLGGINGNTELDLVLQDEEEIAIWHQLVDEDLSPTCEFCGKEINPKDVKARIETPIYPEKTPLPMNECVAYCPHCNARIHQEYAEIGYPFASVDYMRLAVQTELEKNKKNKKG